MSKTAEAGVRRALVMPSLAQDRIIRRGARSDPDAQPMTSKELAGLVPLRALRGRPRLDAPKVLVSIRYSPEVLDFFRAGGTGWQTRMNEVLSRHVVRQSRRRIRASS
jgi:uncharacterized protein (DUF4415 family)